MTDTNTETKAKVTIRLSGLKDSHPICSLLRGLLSFNREDDGRARPNGEFGEGTTITFTDEAKARNFVKDVRRLLSKEVCDRLDVTLHG